MHPKYQKADELTKVVIDAAIAVHHHFGDGLPEPIYVKALEQALKVAGHKVEREKLVTISYMGATFDEKLRCDLQKFRMQLLSYMKLLDMPLGLVMNFSDEHFARHGISRVILKGADDGAAPF